MKIVLMFITLILLAGVDVFSAESPKPKETSITLALPNGKSYDNVSFVRMNGILAEITHAAGVAKVPYTQIPMETRRALNMPTEDVLQKAMDAYQQQQAQAKMAEKENQERRKNAWEKLSPSSQKYIFESRKAKKLIKLDIPLDGMGGMVLVVGSVGVIHEKGDFF